MTTGKPTILPTTTASFAARRRILAAAAGGLIVAPESAISGGAILTPNMTVCETSAMASRKKIRPIELLAAALREIAGIPVEHAKLMSAEQVVSLFQFDHTILHAHGGADEHWNLTPMLIAPHRATPRASASARSTRSFSGAC